MTLLINLKKAEHRNKDVFVYCFRCLTYSHLSKVNLPLIPEKMEGKQKLVRKFVIIRVKESRNRVPSNIAAREQKQSFVSKS